MLSIVFVLIAGTASASLGSPSSVKIDSGNSFFQNYDGKVIVLEWTADSFTGSETVTVEPNDVNSKIKGEIKEPVTLKMSNKDSFATYEIRDGGRTDVRELEYAYNQWYWGKKLITAPDLSKRKDTYDKWARQNCEFVRGENIWYKNEWLTGFLNDNVNGEVICSKLGTKIAEIGEIESTPEETMKATFTLSAGRKSSSVTVGNTYSSEVSKSLGTKNLGSFAKIDFKGGLESGYNFPNPDDELVAQSNKFSNNWRIIQNTESEQYGTSYSEYLSWIDSQDTEDRYSNVLTNPNDGITEKSVESTSERKASDAVEKYSDSEFYSNNLKFKGSSISDGAIKLDAGRSGSYPQFRVILKADEVSYTIPDATPQIVSSSTVNDKIREGQRGTVEFSVKNVGNGRGSFTATMQCGSNFEAVDSRENFNGMSAGETRSGTLQYTFTSGSNQNPSASSVCEITVENVQDDQETVSTQVEVKGEQEKQCTPNRHITNVVDSDNDGKLETQILKCGSDGLTKTKVKTCDDDERAKRISSDKFTCKKEVDPTPEICGDDIDNDNDGKVNENPPCGGNPNPPEQCGDGVDNDNDGKVDENPPCGDGKKKCLINQPIGFGAKFKALCFNQSTFALLKWAVVAITGLIGGYGGYSAGRAFTGFGRRPPANAQGGQGGNRNDPNTQGRGAVRRRRNPIPLLLGLLGFILGGAIGLWLGVLGAGLVLIGLIVLQIALPFI